MKGQLVYIKGIQKENPDRNDNIIVECGNEHTWTHKKIQICTGHCYSENELRDKYTEKGLSAYSIDELLEEIKRRVNK